MAEKKDVWDFVVEFLPNYTGSDLVAYEGDLHKILNDEHEPGDCASDLLLKDYGGYRKHPGIQHDHRIVYIEILEGAIKGYLNQQP